jgi:hypothetical protein
MAENLETFIEKTELQKWYKRYKNEIRGGDK